MAWMHNHQSAYWKAVDSVLTSQWYCPTTGLAQSAAARGGRSSKPPSASGDSCRRCSRPGKPGPQRRSTAKPAQFTEDNEGESDDGGIVCDLSNMVITDELRQYFAQTERHREERRKYSPPRLRPVFLPSCTNF